MSLKLVIVVAAVAMLVSVSQGATIDQLKQSCTNVGELIGR